MLRRSRTSLLALLLRNRATLASRAEKTFLDEKRRCNEGKIPLWRVIMGMRGGQKGKIPLGVVTINVVVLSAGSSYNKINVEKNRKQEEPRRTAAEARRVI